MQRSRSEQLRLGALGAALALAIIFAVLNLDRVRVNWIVTHSATPLIFVIAVSFVLGAIVGVSLWRRR